MVAFRIPSLFVAATLIVSSGAAAAPRAVIELFTSQGCSSCPPADLVLAELAKDPDIVTLSLPVDYWDYLGWKDTLAQPAFSQRQRIYAGIRGDRQIYTPQAVVNGTSPTIGSDRGQIEGAIAAAGRPTLPVPVSVSETGPMVTIDVGPSSDKTSGEIWLVPVTKTREVAIGRGENHGRSLIYTNVVRGLVRVGAWAGAPVRVQVPLERARSGGADAYVVMLQASDQARPGRILGAAKGPGL